MIVWSLNYITAVFKMQHLAMFNFSSDILKFKTFVTVFFIIFVEYDEDSTKSSLWSLKFICVPEHLQQAPTFSYPAAVS